MNELMDSIAVGSLVAAFLGQFIMMGVARHYLDTRRVPHEHVHHMIRLSIYLREHRKERTKPIAFIVYVCLFFACCIALGIAYA